MAKVGSLSPSEIRFALAEGRHVRYTTIDGNDEFTAIIMNCDNATFPEYRIDLFVMIQPRKNSNWKPPMERYLSEVRFLNNYKYYHELPFWWLCDVSFSATKQPGTWHPIEYVPEIVLWQADPPVEPPTVVGVEAATEKQQSDNEVSITLTFPNTDFDLVALENALQWVRAKADEEKFRRDRGAKDAFHVLHVVHERAMKATGHPEWIQPASSLDEKEGKV